MAFTSGFFNSYKGDRKYNAEQMSEIFDGVLADGIIPSQGQLFDVNTASNGMQITIGTGRAWFDHTWSKNDSVMVLTVEPSDITRPRYDTVVIEVNHEDDVRANSIKIIKGVAAVNADKPILLNTDKVKQYPLAHILVRAGTEEIRAADIENWVGRSPTVFATGILETAPLDDLWSQWKGEWEDWFASIKLQLSGDIVTNLQYQIDQLREFDKSVLSDFTKGLYGLSEDGTPDNIFQMIYYTAVQGKSFARIVAVNSSGQKIEGIYANITKSSGNLSNVEIPKNGLLVVTNAKESVTVTVTSKYIDLSGTVTATALDTGILDVRLPVDYVDYALISSSRSIMFSDKVDHIDVSMCGGGGGGGGSFDYLSSMGTKRRSGPGGGGGYVTTKTNVYVASDFNYQITIGSGGSGGTAQGETTYNVDPTLSNGKSGGQTSAFSLTADGGGGGMSSNTTGSNGGSGNGTGATSARSNDSGSGAYLSAYGNSGSAGSQYIYSSMTETTRAGGGGGSGAVGLTTVGSSGYNYPDNPTTYSGGNGGAPAGGKGGSQSVDKSKASNSSYGQTYTSPTAGTSPGGGGGGGLSFTNTGVTATNGARGGSGAVAIRIYHKP